MTAPVPCLDPMAPVFIGLGQRVKVARPSRQVPQWWRLSWQPPERTAQVRKIDNTFDPLTWSIFPGVFHGTGLVSGSVTCLDL